VWQAALVLLVFLFSVCGKEIKLRLFIKVDWEFLSSKVGTGLIYHLNFSGCKRHSNSAIKL
jgi:hypothetical protein